MSSTDEITPSEWSLPPLSEHMEALLREAMRLTGQTQEEILYVCLNHGLHTILAETPQNETP
jgi:hypothetical protein